MVPGKDHAKRPVEQTKPRNRPKGVEVTSQIYKKREGYLVNIQ